MREFKDEYKNVRKWNRAIAKEAEKSAKRKALANKSRMVKKPKNGSSDEVS